MTDNNYEGLTQLLESHLDSKNLNVTQTLWRIQDSPTGGRGIFVNRDIKIGEVILIDHPLIIGPRTSNDVPFHCVICSKSSGLVVCSKGCGLPVCSDDCEQSATHQKECDLIRKWSIEEKIDEISVDLFGGLTPFRAFFLDENRRKLLTSLVSHARRFHASEVELVKRKIKLEANDEKFMREVCYILDSNAFETKVTSGDTETSLRGLYPLSSLVNHSCTPNTTYLFDVEQNMMVKATVPIEKDSEIYDIYVDPLWGTTARRHSLKITKHFLCECRRCKDPSEFGTYLNGLKCRSPGCQGVLLPLDPLDDVSEWRCESCQSLVNRQKIGIMQSGVGGFMKTVDLSKIDNLVDFVENQLSKFVPAQNQIAIELKVRIVQILGNNEKYSWNILTLDQLNYKEVLCKDLLKVIADLQLGQLKLRGVILYELYRCQLEKCLRTALIDKLNETEDLQRECRRNLMEAAEILANDRAAPSDIKSLKITQNFQKI